MLDVNENFEKISHLCSFFIIAVSEMAKYMIHKSLSTNFRFITELV